MMLPDTATTAEALAAWDAGESLFTLEMGGLGPGYEQAIHLLVWEIVRDGLAAGLTSEDALTPQWDTFGDATAHRVNDALGGLTGAQFGAAKWLASRFLVEGYDAFLTRARSVGQSDRLIQVSRTFPSLPVPTPVATGGGAA